MEVAMSEHILIVDDEREIADLLEVYLKNEGYQVHKFYHGKGALECLKNTKIDLALLDIMLPDIDGFTLCREIRQKWFFPVIMLTAKAEDGDKIMGITLGADDYITKPFNPLEVTARVRAQLRRVNMYNTRQTEEDPDYFNIDGLEVNGKNHVCLLYGTEIALTPLEFSILFYLCQRRGNVVSAEELFEKVWGERYLDSNNTVMTHIAKLREKLKENARKPKFIKTVWGVGYKIE